MHALPPDEEMYRALVLRDPSYDGVFLACVRTTGIFCRPTCRARKPRTENVEYVATATAALHAGYRPCKICRPLGGEEIHPPWVLPLLEPARRVTDRALLRDRIDPARVRRRRYSTKAPTIPVS